MASSSSTKIGGNKSKIKEVDIGDDEKWKIPTEMSPEEYGDLQSQIKELSISEAQEEYMESCRYGEIDIVRALLGRLPSLVDFVNEENGNTGLHMAAANGHTELVKLLVSQNHLLSKNDSGNTPLHWAAERGQGAVVEILTTQIKNQEVDVLQRNDFGRSALTEGFTSQNESVVKSLLEHESATEEKLLSTDNKSQDSVTHKFFDAGNPILVRELAITNADNPFADTDKPDNDTTGLSIWAASLVLARWMRTKESLWKGASVLELGAGCGVPGLTIGKADPSPDRVYISDLNPRAVENIEHNISLNKLSTITEALRMDWNDTTTWPKQPVDYVIGSDLIYQKSLVPLLVGVIQKVVKPGGIFFYVAPAAEDGPRDGLKEFIREMKKVSTKWNEEPATNDMISNPLANQDEEECFLHFQELSTLSFVLYEFRIPE